MDQTRLGQWRATTAHRGTQFCISCEKPIVKGSTYYQIIDEDSEIIRLCTTCYNKPHPQSAQPLIYVLPEASLLPPAHYKLSIEDVTIEGPEITLTGKLDPINPDRFNYGGPDSDLRD